MLGVCPLILNRLASPSRVKTVSGGSTAPIASADRCHRPNSANQKVLCGVVLRAWQVLGADLDGTRGCRRPHVTGHRGVDCRDPGPDDQVARDADRAPRRPVNPMCRRTVDRWILPPRSHRVVGAQRAVEPRTHRPAAADAASWVPDRRLTWWSDRRCSSMAAHVRVVAPLAVGPTACRR